MKTISAKDASCLAMGATYPTMSAQSRAEYLEIIKDPEAKLVFQALTSDPSEWGEYSPAVVKAAKLLLGWAEENRRRAKAFNERPCPHCGRALKDCC